MILILPYHHRRYKPVKKSRIVNGKRVSSFLHNNEKMWGGAGFHLSSTLSDERRREELRKTIRRQLRQHVITKPNKQSNLTMIY